MKNVFKFFGITTLVAVIIFTMAACKKNKEQESATNQSSKPSVAVKEPSSNDESLYDAETEHEYLEARVPPDFRGHWEIINDSWRRVFDWKEILKGNLEDFVGYWTNGKGESILLDRDGRIRREDGTINEGQTASGFTRQNNSKMASGGDFYMWGVNSEGGGFAMVLFPTGVEVMGYDGIIQTDKTKIRLTMGQDLPSSSADVFYITEQGIESADYSWSPK